MLNANGVPTLYLNGTVQTVQDSGTIADASVDNSTAADFESSSRESPDVSLTRENRFECSTPLPLSHDTVSTQPTNPALSTIERTHTNKSSIVLDVLLTSENRLKLTARRRLSFCNVGEKSVETSVVQKRTPTKFTERKLCQNSSCKRRRKNDSRCISRWKTKCSKKGKKTASIKEVLSQLPESYQLFMQMALRNIRVTHPKVSGCCP